MRMKVVVTGGAGFIGSHLCETLLARGCDVVALDNFDGFYDPAIKRANIEPCLEQPKFSLVQGDIRDAKLLAEVLRDGAADVLVHLAAKAGVRPSIADPVGYCDVNVNGTVCLLEAARRYGLRKFIFGSSSSIYGNNRKVPFAESDNVDFPISPYAASKKAGELFCHAYSHLYGMAITSLRFFTVYGPRQRPDLAIHKFTKLIETGQPIPIFGDGSMSRDFTYVDDIVAGVIAAIDSCQGYHIYNLGNSQPVVLRDLVKAIETALGKKAVIDRQPLQPGDVARTFADITAAGRDLGYKPATDMAVGLGRFVEWFRENQQLVIRP